jgi:hypothetical protein
MADPTALTTLVELKAWLQGIGKGQPVPLTAAGFASAMVGNIFGLLGLTGLTIEGNSQKDIEQGVVVSGTCSLLGYDGLVVTATFTQADNTELALALALTLDPSVQWSLLDVLPVHIENISLSFQPDTSLKVFTVDISADLVAKSLSLPIGLRLPTYDGDWELHGEFGDTGKGFGIDDLIALAAGQNALSQLPTDLQALTSLAIREVQMAFNPHAGSVSYISILLDFNKDWTFFSGGLVAKGITLNVVIPFTKDKAGTLHVSLEGTILIDDVPVLLGAQFPDEVMWASLDDQHPLKLNSVFAYFNVAVPGGFPNIQIDRLSISFDLVNNGFTFDLAILGEIPFAPDLNSLHSLTIQVQKQGTATASGTFVTTMGIGGAPLILSAAYAGAESGLTLSGKAADISLSDLNKHLVETYGVSIPKSLLSVTIKDLETTYDTSTKAFHFKLDGGLTIESEDVEITVGIDITPSSATGDATQADAQTETNSGVPRTGSFNSIFSGTVKIANLLFSLVFETGAETSDYLVASYSPSGDPDSISLHDLVAGISLSLAEPIPEGIEVQLLDVKFVFQKQDASKQFAFGLDLAASLELSNLPIVGSKLPPDLTLSVSDLQGIYSSAPFTAAQASEINKLLPSQVTAFPVAGMSKGVNLLADLQLGSESKHLTYGIPEKTTGALSAPVETPTDKAPVPPQVAEPATVNEPSDAPSPSIKWIDVNKQFSIFQFDRIGIGYQDNILLFALDAAVSLGPLTFSMDGLSVGSPLKKFAPVINLNGLGLTFVQPSLEIGGSFLKVAETDGDKTSDSYYGEVIVKTANFSVKAIGGWSPEAHPASFFLYANVNVPIGGPPFLFITGLASGMGINRSLILPTIDELSGFILLPDNAPPQVGSPSAAVSSVLPQLQTVFRDDPGEYWLAAGIKFTSFEMINAFALVIVKFGVDVQVTLLGNCAMTFPKGDPHPVAYVEVDLIASFTPATGLLAVDGKLSPTSFIYGGFCKLSGGFAFYAWFAGQHEGDFVVTLGGYHPAFTKPPHYPTVPRLGMNFALGPFQVTGTAYFAFTPSMMMAGVRMSAVWSSGSIKAWLDAGVDFLISWAPFHYEADAYINIGCSVDLGLFTLNVDVGANLNIWGPPFGGQAHIDLDVVSFTISFGADAAPPPPPVGWDTFKSKFLPQDSGRAKPNINPQRSFRTALAQQAPQSPDATNIIKASVPTGLLQSDISGVDWILEPDHFVVLTNSTVPANNGEWKLSEDTAASLPNTVSSYNPAQVDVTAGPYLRLPSSTKTYSEAEVWTPVLDIGPMGKESVQSYHTIKVCKLQPDGTFSDFIKALSVTPVLLASNTALWVKNNPNKTPNDPSLIPSTLTGFLITPIPRVPVQVNDVPLIELLFAEGSSTNFNYQGAAVVSDYTVTWSIAPSHDLMIVVQGRHTATIKNQGYILSALADNWISTQRASILDDLVANDFSTYTSAQIDLDILATKKSLTDWPLVEMLGS